MPAADAGPVCPSLQRHILPRRSDSRSWRPVHSLSELYLRPLLSLSPCPLSALCPAVLCTRLYSGPMQAAQLNSFRPFTVSHSLVDWQRTESLPLPTCPQRRHSSFIIDFNWLLPFFVVPWFVSPAYICRHLC